MKIARSIEELHGFVEQWVKTQQETETAIKAKDFRSIYDHVSLFDIKGGGNFVNCVGYRHLENSANAVLDETEMSRRVKRSSILKLIQKEFSIEREKAQNGKKFSTDAIIDRTKLEIKKLKFSDGIYVYPVLFAGNAQESDFVIGPVRIISKENFLAEYGGLLDEDENKEKIGAPHREGFIGRWRRYVTRYDHFALVKLEGFEWGKAWAAGEECVEFALNFVRMCFGYHHTKYIKLAGGYIFDDSKTKIMISTNGSVGAEHSDGPWGSHLGKAWEDMFDQRLGWASGALSSLCSWMASGDHPQDPILERQLYAHKLIAEAYSEPHDHIRLLRLIAALEALAVLDQDQRKSEPLALRCAQVGGFANPSMALEIFESVVRAYKIRNKIVHGDRASLEEINAAFFNLEKYILEVVEGYTMLHVRVFNKSQPRHIKHLRREIRRSVDLFFWDMDLPFSK